MVPEMIESFKNLTNSPENFNLPITFEWPERNLSIIIDNLVRELPGCL